MSDLVDSGSRKMAEDLIDLTALADESDQSTAKRRRTAGWQPIEGPASAGDLQDPSGRPRLLAGFGYLCTKHCSEGANRGVIGVRLTDLIDWGTKWALIEGYRIDLAWLLTNVPALLSAERLVVVHGQAGETYETKTARDKTTESIPKPRREAITSTQTSSMRDINSHPGIIHMHRILTASGHPSWVLHAPAQPIPYGTMHTKMVMLHCAAGVRVIVQTANLLRAECNKKTQGIWWQDFPLKDAASPRSSDFERELHLYLRALNLDRDTAHQALSLVEGHDFSSARAALVPSVPGTHKGPSRDMVGHTRVRQLLQERCFPPAFQETPLVAQFSSMGSLTEAWLAELGASFSAGRCQSGGSLGLAKAPGTALPGTPHLVWPTVGEVRDSLEGWRAGGSIPGSRENVQRAFLQPLLHRFGGEPVGRERAMPHIKSFARYTEDGRLAWAMLGSHNLSKAAWGQLQNGGSELKVASYEMGVLFLADLELAYRKHRHFGYCCSTGSGLPRPPIPESLSFRAGTAESVQQGAETSEIADIVLPYKLPPAVYRPGHDAPWIINQAHLGLDSHGFVNWKAYIAMRQRLPLQT